MDDLASNRAIEEGHGSRLPRALKVLLTGNLTDWELGQAFRRGFSTLGHQTALFDWYGGLHAWNSRVPDRLSQTVLTAVGRRMVAHELVASVRAQQPDLLVMLKTDDLPGGTIPRLRKAAPGCRIVAFHPDDPFNIHRLRGPSHPRGLLQMRGVDHYFIWSERLIDRIRGQGARAVSYLGFGCDPAFTRPLALTPQDRERFGADISFVGNWDPKREEWIAPFAHASDLSVAIWGAPYWRDRARDDRVRACWRGVALGDDFVKAVLAARVSLNVLRVVNETGENMRTYEIPGCGGVMLAEWSMQQARIFRPQREAFYAHTPTEAVATLRGLVARPAEDLLPVSKAALERALTQTYAARAQTIVDVVFGAP